MWKRWFGKSRTPPRVPDGVRIYAISDVHGRVDLLDPALARIDADIAAHPIAQPVQIFLGDYVDRGPSSRDVLDRLVARGQSGETIFLKGNHEAILLEFLERPHVLADWAQYGGLETLLSYGLRPSLSASEDEQSRLSNGLREALPASHRVFLENLKTSHQCGDFFFVHAGVKPGVALVAQREEDLLWIREEFLLYEEPLERVIVHGHTPVRLPDIRPNRINIDTGAYATGKLTCLTIEADKIQVL